MKILLTGACGMLGRGIRRCCSGEHELVLFDTSEAVVQLGGIRASVTDTEAVEDAARGCDAIIHTAAMHGGSYGKASNAQFLQVNVLGAENIFQAALRHGIRRLVLSSTLEVLIGWTGGAYGNAVLEESLAPRPDWIYPVSKVMVEQLSAFYAVHHGLEVVNLRYCGLHEKPLEELGFGLLARQLPATDAARANLLAATRPGLRNEVFNIAPDTPLTQQDSNEAALLAVMRPQLHGAELAAEQAKNLWTILERHWPGCGAVLRAHGLEPQPEFFWRVTRIDKAKLTLGWQPVSDLRKVLKESGLARGSAAKYIAPRRRPGPRVASSTVPHPVTDALPVVEGAVAVPQGLGLGMELDRAALDRYTKRRFTVKLG